MRRVNVDLKYIHIQHEIQTFRVKIVKLRMINKYICIILSDYQRHSSVYDRQRQTPTPTPSRASPEIPEEVLEFLHSKNFQPEVFDRLQDILRRGGSAGESGIYEQRTASASPSRYENRRPGRPEFRHYPETDPSRDRPIGNFQHVFKGRF